MGVIRYTGVSESRSAKIAANIINEKEGICLVVSPTFETAKAMADDLAFFVDKEIILMNDQGHQLASYEAENIDGQVEREKAINAIKEDADKVIVIEALGAAKKVESLNEVSKKNLEVKIGGTIDYKEFGEKLFALGYERENYVYSKGQFAIRGSVIDVFPISCERPIRLDLFGEEVEKIRYFNIESQFSEENIENAQITQAREDRRISGEGLIPFWKYFKEGLIIIDDPSRAYQRIRLREEEIKDDFPIYLKNEKVTKEDIKKFTFTDEYIKIYQENSVYVLTAFADTIEGIETYGKLENITCYQGVSFNGDLKSLKREAENYLKEGYEIYLVAETEGRAQTLRDFILDEDIKGNIAVVIGELTTGMVLVHEKLCYMTDKDIFGYRKHKKKVQLSERKSSRDIFSEIEKDDIVVHEKYGIGRFLGNSTITVKGKERELLKIKYGGEDVLYVPMDQIDLVQKYTGSENPKLTRLGSPEWENVKKRTKKAIKDMAKELLALTAKRKAEGGYAFAKDGPWQADFDDKFPYIETDDQLRCIEEIKEDMEKSEPMDRLLCGDVGYGKTEVASRAIFKCIAEGKQAAILGPTTILVNQHYLKLKERFSDFPVNIEMLSRFKTAKEQTEIIKKLETGEVDIVIGTHRLLSKDVKFKDIGLLVVDEEQKFGVAAKEKIKALKIGVDMLALTATPIPRTLHMSLVGIKALSLIEEPPEERIPIQTYVLEEDQLLIKEAIKRELERGGQTYIVTNKIQGIQKLATDITKLVPEAQVAVGHGRMKEDVLEEVMIDFTEGKTNVLIATTIIESGIDIPNVNTLIVIDADKFGLAQLYQIRGRVGRSNRMAYAYLMHKKEKILTEVAAKRLSTIKEFTQFGAGFKIAMRDLEIRGSGNILGGEQHGHMINIGYDLYCKLVEEVVNELELEGQGIQVVAKFNEETKLDIDVTAYIPITFVESETQRIEIYKRIVAVKDLHELKKLEQEISDMFGKLPFEVENLLRVGLIKNMAKYIQVESITLNKGKVNIKYFEQTGKGSMTVFVEEQKDKGRKLLKELYSVIHILYEKQKAAEKGENKA